MITQKPSEIDGIDIREILRPRPAMIEINGHKIPVMPMVDDTYIHAAEDIEIIVGCLREVADANGGVLFAESTIMQAIPAMSKVAIPAITRLVSLALALEPEFVQTIALNTKVQIVAKILEAEKASELSKNVGGLLSGFLNTQEEPSNPEPTTTS